MSEETKKILNLIYHLTNEVRRNYHNSPVISPGARISIHKSILKDIHKEFPEFKPSKG